MLYRPTRYIFLFVYLSTICFVNQDWYINIDILPFCYIYIYCYIYILVLSTSSECLVVNYCIFIRKPGYRRRNLRGSHLCLHMIWTSEVLLLTWPSRQCSSDQWRRQLDRLYTVMCSSDQNFVVFFNIAKKRVFIWTSLQNSFILFRIFIKWYRNVFVLWLFLERNIILYTVWFWYYKNCRFYRYAWICHPI